MKREDINRAVQTAWPAIVESFFVAFAGLVDSLMVSSLGAYAVAAVGLTTQPKFLGLAIFMAVNVSVSALVARRRGESKKEEANRIFAAAIVFVLILVVIISTSIFMLADPIIRFCGSEAQTHDSAVAYLRIIIGGMVFNVLQMCINSAQRGAGNTQITMVTNLVSNSVNILFNFLLIEGRFGFPAMGIRGAAFATVLGTVVACILSTLSILRKEGFINIIYIFRNRITPGITQLRQLIHVGYGICLEQFLMRIGLVLTSLMAADQGTEAMAAHQVGANILGLSFSFGDGLQVAAVALIGYSLGEKKPDDAKKYGKICQYLGAAISFGLALFFLFGGRWLYSLFFQEENIVEIGVSLTRIVILIVIFQISQVIYMGCLRGAGDTFYTAMVSLVCVTVIRTVGAYIGGYVLHLGIAGIWLGILGDQVARFAFALMRFKKGKWTQIRI